METRTYIKNVKTSPKKLRFLLSNIKKIKPENALDYLFYTNKKSAKLLYKALKSAINNIKKSKNISNETIKFKLISVEEGRKLKRYRSRGRGAVKQYQRRNSHIKIILEAQEKKPNEPKIDISKDKKVKKIKYGTKS
jgi:large subunit ribosomal protein L22